MKISVSRQNILLLLTAVIIAAVPLFLRPDAVFGGADDSVKDTVEQVQPGYQPWSKHIWEPPSSEVESLLFAVQAGLGAGFIGFYFGYLQGRKAEKKVKDAEVCTKTVRFEGSR